MKHSELDSALNAANAIRAIIKLASVMSRKFIMNEFIKINIKIPPS